LQTIARRCSVRQFEPRQIGDEELAAILEAGLQAPSGHDDQSWYFVAVQNRQRIDELSEGTKAGMRLAPVDWITNLGKAEKYHIFYQAPAVILVATRKDAVSPVADACAAIENMLLAAESLGVGSCWMGFVAFYFTDDESHRRFDIPDGYQVHYAVALGYKPEGLSLTPPQRKREKYYHVIK
ncbi:MAG TPA: nitroreductase family protein, partial [Candidatus Aminicenantes bacterium]|nr:nitroreductase family protein [Candidatus Aminicenantes bacterium]